MRDTYSLYEAKAKLSAIVRRVRKGHRVIVTVHGEPAVEIRPVTVEEPAIESRMAQLAERGLLIRTAHPRAPGAPVARRPGALKRFLDDRDE
ncbi:MAG: type II toxin-antitoxin system Phd/YefM family antitoxin [Gemmatimonadaceae bacterium]